MHNLEFLSRSTLLCLLLVLRIGAAAAQDVVSPVGDAVAPQSREVIFVIDTSVSMEGVSLARAKAALYHGLDQLNADDLFNLIQLNADNPLFFSHSVPADDVHLLEALDFIDALGYSDLLPAGSPTPPVTIPPTGSGWFKQLLMSLATLLFATCLLWFSTPSRTAQAGSQPPPPNRVRTSHGTAECTPHSAACPVLAVPQIAG